MPKIGFKIIFVSPLPSAIINYIKYVGMILHIFTVLLSIGPLQAGSSNQGVALAAINLPSVWPRIQVLLGTILYWSLGCLGCSWGWWWWWWGTNIRSLFCHINLSCLVIFNWLDKICRNAASILQRILTTHDILVYLESHQCGHLTCFILQLDGEGRALLFRVAMQTTLRYSWYLLQATSQFSEVIPRVRASQ